MPVFLKAMSRANVWIYTKTGGRIGGKFRVAGAGRKPLPVCLLTTRGRKSGKRRTAPLLFLEDDKRVIVVASQGGLPRHPQWYLNLQAEPSVELQIGGKVRRMRARTANAQERAHLWPRLVEMYPDYARYQSWTDRVIPVVICEPE